MILSVLSKATILKQYTQPRYFFESLLLCIPLYNSHLYFFIKILDGKNFFRFFSLTYYKKVMKKKKKKKVMSKHLLLKKKQKPTKNPKQARLSYCTHSGEEQQEERAGRLSQKSQGWGPRGGLPWEGHRGGAAGVASTAPRLDRTLSTHSSSSCAFDSCSFNSTLLINDCFISPKNKRHVR